MVNDWMIDQKQREQYAQRVLAKILEEHEDINIYELPLKYCYIKTLPQGEAPLIKLDPVILHHQVSRNYKNKSI